MDKTSIVLSTTSTISSTKGPGEIFGFNDIIIYMAVGCANFMSLLIVGILWLYIFFTLKSQFKGAEIVRSMLESAKEVKKALHPPVVIAVIAAENQVPYDKCVLQQKQKKEVLRKRYSVPTLKGMDNSMQAIL